MVYLLSAWVKTKKYLIGHGETTTATVNVYKTTFNLHLYMAIIYIGCCGCCCCHLVCRTHCLTFLYYRWRNEKQMQQAAAHTKSTKKSKKKKNKIVLRTNCKAKWKAQAAAEIQATKYLNKMPAIQIVQCLARGCRQICQFDAKDEKLTVHATSTCTHATFGQPQQSIQIGPTIAAKSFAFKGISIGFIGWVTDNRFNSRITF